MSDKLREAALKAPNHRYSASKGITKLRTAICDWYRRRYEVDLDPENEAIVTIGAKEGISHMVLAMISPGDVVFAPNPTYPIHPYSVIIAGGDLRSIPLRADRDFFEDLRVATKQTWPSPKMLLVLQAVIVAAGILVLRGVCPDVTAALHRIQRLRTGIRPTPTHRAVIGSAAKSAPSWSKPERPPCSSPTTRRRPWR